MSETAESTPAYRAGGRAGAGLLTSDPSHVRALAEAQLARNERVQKLDIELGQLEIDEKTLKEVSSSRREILTTVEKKVRELESEYDQNPVGANWIMGLGYLVMSVAILLADFVFLTQIVARTMDLPLSIDIDGLPVTAVGVLFRPDHWQEGLTAFVDVYFTTFGILLLGMSFKAFAESLARRRTNEDGSAVPRSRTARAFASFRTLVRRIPAFLVVALATMTLLALAYARTIDPGDPQATSPGDLQAKRELQNAFRNVAALIGLATPAVGVYLFSRGLSAVSTRIYRFHIGRREVALVRQVKGVDRELLDVRKKKIALERERAEITCYTTQVEAEKVVADEFRLGYASAVKQLLDGKGESGSYRQLRTQLLIPERGHR